MQSEYCFHFFHAAFYETKVVPHFYLLLLTYIFLQQIIFVLKLSCSQESLFSFSLHNKRDFEINTLMFFAGVVHTTATRMPCTGWNRTCGKPGSAWPFSNRSFPRRYRPRARGRQGSGAAGTVAALWNKPRKQKSSESHRLTEVTKVRGFSGTCDSIASWKTYL